MIEKAKPITAGIGVSDQIKLEKSSLSTSSTTPAISKPVLDSAFKVIQEAILQNLGELKLVIAGHPDFKAIAMKKVFDEFEKTLDSQIKVEIDQAINADFTLLKRATVIALTAMWANHTPDITHAVERFQVQQATTENREALDRNLRHMHPDIFLAAKVCALGMEVTKFETGIFL